MKNKSSDLGKVKDEMLGILEDMKEFLVEQMEKMQRNQVSSSAGTDRFVMGLEKEIELLRKVSWVLVVIGESTCSRSTRSWATTPRAR